jgi:outer membrane lipoprotein SlyB
MSKVVTQTQTRPAMFSAIRNKATQFADSVRERSQTSYQKLEAKQGSFYNLARKYDETNTVHSSAAKAVWKASFIGGVVGGIAGGILGGILSVSLFGSDLGLTAGWGAWRGAAVGVVAGGVVGFLNHKKSIETNFVNNLIKDKNQMIGSTQYKITRLEKIINTRGSVLKEAMRFNFLGALKNFRDLDYKNQLRSIADDNRCTLDINAYIQRLHAAKEISKQEAATQEAEPFNWNPAVQEAVDVTVQPFFKTSPKGRVV